ncbi:hypothetical protein GCM10009798_39240 [Nocardioides panacihumi]|uniref:Glycosyltransferase family 2 protein n=1 Tax=Nocardioides panacihumi TaxID=400774 RepID=A0ABN2RSN8_9ACTN
MTQSAAPLRIRVARLSWLSAIIALAAVALIVLAGLLTAWETPDRTFSAVVPVPVRISWPGVGALFAAALLAAAAVIGITALQTAAAAQVLGRRGGPRQRHRLGPEAARRARLTLLTPPVVQALGIDEIPVALPSARPAVAASTRLRCTVLIPAHDEEAVLGATLASLAAQRRPPDHVVVVADNCSDGTVELARAHGVDVVETVGNTEKKAGALNQQLERLLPDAGSSDVVMVMDADSTISAEFLEVALALLEHDADLMAVGGLFYGDDDAGLIAQLQRNEFTRYQRIVARRRNRVFVLTGTAAVMRAYALRAVADSRGELIPGPAGMVYDTLAMTEDNELTLALKTLGAKLTSPPQCRVTTEVMPRWRDLWRQRLRWHRGALENIGVYGLTRATTPYWVQQLGLGYGVLALWSYLALMVITLLAADTIRWSPFWVTIGLVFVVERLVTVWAVGWRGRAIAAPIVIELAYAMFLQVCFVVSLLQIASGRKAGWNYVPRSAEQGLAPVLLAPYAITSLGILLPTSILSTDWYQILCVWVGFNTLVFAGLSLLQILPPLRRASRSP